MASTNKTTNLSLSQFIATDKPSWLSDYNADMLKIDTGYGTAIADASSAVSGAASASAAANTAQGTANSALEKANANAASISTINTNLTFGNFPISKNTTNVSSGSFYGTGNSLFISLKVNLIGISLTSTVVYSDYTRIPLASCAQNIFALTVSTLSDNNNKFNCGYFLCRYTWSSESITNPAPIYAFYDGANTVFYTVFATSALPSSINSIGGNSTILKGTDLYD